MALRLLLILMLCLGGCAQQWTREVSQALPPAASPFGQRLERLASAHEGRSGFRLLPASDEAFIARLELIRAARSGLDLQYYIVHDGLSTRLLVDELLRAADRGVRVRLLLDDLTSDGFDHEIGLLCAHPNIQARVFNPLHLGRATGVTRLIGRSLNLARQHRRMHNKLWLADSSAAIVGGRNLGDEYFDAEPSFNFTDIDLLGVGPVAGELAHSFDQYWNSALSKPIEQFLWRVPTRADLAQARRRLGAQIAAAEADDNPLHQRLFDDRRQRRLKRWLDELIWAPSLALWDAPSKILSGAEPDPQLLMATQLAPEMQRIEQELLMVSSYFVPAKEGMVYLTAKADAGIDIRLLTNALEATDVPPVHGGYAPYRKALLEHGIRLFELRRQPGDAGGGSAPYSLGSSASSLHSKAMVFDRRKAFIGSFNFDPRSVLWNTEVGVLVDSPELSERVRQLILEGMAPALAYEVRLDARGQLVWVTEDDGRPRTLDQEPGGFWRHLNTRVSDWIGLERLL
ncbi:Cardiolipin synthase C [compost metagenome]